MIYCCRPKLVPRKDYSFSKMLRADPATGPLLFNIVLCLLLMDQARRPKSCLPE